MKIRNKTKHLSCNKSNYTIERQTYLFIETLMEHGYGLQEIQDSIIVGLSDKIDEYSR